MPNPVTVTHYRDAEGIAHDVAVEKGSQGRWRIVDIAGDTSVLIEELTGIDDGEAQAEAVAHDHASDRAASHATPGIR